MSSLLQSFPREWLTLELIPAQSWDSSLWLVNELNAGLWLAELSLAGKGGKNQHPGSVEAKIQEVRK